MKKICLLIISIIIAEVAFTQNDTAAINRFGLLEVSDNELIIRCRNLILESLFSNDKQELLKLTEYAYALNPVASSYNNVVNKDNNTNNQRYKVYGMLDYEKWLIYLYLHKFSDITDGLKAYNAETEKQDYYKRTYNSAFVTVLYDSLYANYNDILLSIDKDNCLTQEDKDLLTIFVQNITIKVYPRKVNPRSLGASCNKFIEQYPNSPYLYYLNHNIYVTPEKDEDKFTLDCGLGASFAMFSGDLNHWFGKSHGGVDFDFSMGLRKCEFGILFNVPFVRPQMDIFNDDTVWSKGESSNTIQLQFTFGRRIPIGHSWVFIPRIGMGTAFFETPNIYDDDNNLIRNVKDIEAKWMPVLTTEIRYEKLLLGSDNINKRNIGYLAPTLRYSFHPVKTTINDETVIGAIHSITAVFKIGAGYKKRY